MEFEVKYADSVVKQDIPILPKTIKLRLKKIIEERLSVEPLRCGKPLQYSYSGHRRLRVVDYRIIYKVTEDIIYITKIGHRKDVYE